MSLNVVKLKELNNENPAANAVLKSFKDRKRDREYTDIRQYHTRLSDSGVKLTLEDVMGVFSKLEEVGAGSLILGRGNMPHRFRWGYSLRSLGKVISNPEEQGNVVKLTTTRVMRKHPVKAKPAQTRTVSATIPASVGSSALKFTSPTLIAVYPLREDFRIRLTLPGDLSKDEASKLGEFISTLTNG